MSPSSTSTIEPCGMNVTCRCGHTADLSEFQYTPLTGELPRGHFQCPDCRRAWSYVHDKPTKGWSGMLIPGRKREIAVESKL